MFITVTNYPGDYPDNANSQLFLILDGWNDYNFLTYYGIFYIDENLKKHDLGAVKIGFFGQKIKERKLNVGDSFEILDDSFFSIGTEVEYYEKLKSFDDDLKNKILNSLNDIANNTTLFRKAKYEDVYKVSFLRAISELTITEQFRRLANNGAKLTPFNFSFQSVNNFSLQFQVEPNSLPPSNIHVVIGRNGVGKTHLINNMVNGLLTNNSPNKFLNAKKENIIFSNLICVSFSAFDDFNNINEIRDKSTQINYHYVGIKSTFEQNNNVDIYENISEKLSLDFYISFWNCIKGLKKHLWISILAILESDPIFREMDIKSLTQLDYNDKKFKLNVLSKFKKLSSGHKIVLLTLTKLIEKTEEKSLILLDEPESHLHPPLLSSFTRALSELLSNRNGVAIIATHSPVILQDVPKSCVWKLRRTGKNALAERLQIECFGENVGILTNEVFRLEVTDSGFHKLLQELVNEYEYYDQAIDVLGNQIGLEAKAILRSMFHNKNKYNEEN